MRGNFHVALDKIGEIPTRMHQSGNTGFVLAEIARKIDDVQMRVIFLKRQRYLQRIIWRAIINHDDLVVIGDLGHDSCHLPAEILDARGGIIKGGDDR